MSTGSKWLLGCGIGCGVVILIGVLVGVGGFLFLRGTMDSFNEAVETREALETAHGTVADFVPWPEGPIPADRVAAFLAVRDSLGQVRQEITESLAFFPELEKRLEAEETSTWEKIRLGLKAGREGLGLGGVLGRYYETRNKALLARDMGMGEYTYIYCLAYFSWLGHSPYDAPEGEHLHIQTEDREDFSWEDEHGDWEETAEETRVLMRRVARQLAGMLANQLAALDSLPESQIDPDWHRQLQREVERLEEHPGSMPWTEGLPERIAASLAPYRTRLEETYSKEANVFALSITHKGKGGLRIGAD